MWYELWVLNDNLFGKPCDDKFTVPNKPSVVIVSYMHSSLNCFVASRFETRPPCRLLLFGRNPSVAGAVDRAKP